MRSAAAVVASLCLCAVAQAQGFSRRPQSSLRQDLAAAMGVPIAQIVGDVSAVDFTHAGDARGAIVGRYREKPDGKWTFPGVGVLHPCQAGICITRLHLGASSSRVMAVQLVDLDAPRTQVAVHTSFGPVAPPFVEPPSRVRNPALLVTCVRDTTHEEGSRLVELVVVGLKNPTRPQRLVELELERSSPEPKGEARGTPGPRSRGTRIESLVFAHEGDERTLVVGDRLIDTRFNRCLRPSPGEHRYVLDDDHYRQVASKPSDMCH